MTTEVPDNQVDQEVLRVGDTIVKSLVSDSLSITDDGEGNLTISAPYVQISPPTYYPYDSISTLRIDFSDATVVSKGVSIASNFGIYDRDGSNLKTGGVATAGSIYSGTNAANYTPQSTIDGPNGWGANDVPSWWEVTFPSAIAAVRLYFSKEVTFSTWTTDHATLTITDEAGDQWIAEAPYTNGNIQNQNSSTFNVYLASLDWTLV